MTTATNKIIDFKEYKEFAELPTRAIENYCWFVKFERSAERLELLNLKDKIAKAKRPCPLERKLVWCLKRYKNTWAEKLLKELSAYGVETN